MNLQEYKLLLQQPESFTADQTASLQMVIKQYPFLQSAYAMRLKGLYNENSYQYNHTLKLAAAYTTDRTVLFDFITSEEFAKVSNSAIIEEEIEVVSAKVEVAEVENEPQSEIKPKKQSILDSIESAKAASEEFEIVNQNLDKEETESAEQSVLESIAIAENTLEAIEIDQVSVQKEISSVTYSVLESVNIANNSSEEVEYEKTSTSQFSTDDNLAEAKKIQAEESFSHKISIQEELGTPLQFSTSETHSFKEWLQLSKIQPIIREVIQEEKKELTENELEKIKKTDLIDKFIEASPKIPPVKNDNRTPVIRDTSADTSALMTETLARVYLEQKKYQKAIQAYQILILKYPEKSSFFADRISDIKNIQQNN